ncbi:putative protein YqjZ [Vanrija pseudolonga]|uniref:Purtative protein YqjZ n=1 Tax=Vanrija pseudolonga TaxID=143232 RepID=A0AAF0Y7R5_9TREE|nr:purtative protein YqjZ [Vanrija pseudolonga]
MAFAKHLTPPYYAVIFTSTRRQDDTTDAYANTADRMGQLASSQEGFLGVESVRGADGLGITVSYWRSLEDIAAWKAVSEHLRAQERGRKEWYDHYEVRIARVERAYDIRREGKL